MSKGILGIHHVTAIAVEPQENVDFYAGILGLRLVKQTVNYDDPGTYHLYYGDGQGHPGTIMTFFPWPGARRGQRGTGQVTVTSFSVPEGSFGYWTERLKKHDIAFEDPVRRFDEEVLTLLDDPDTRLRPDIVVINGCNRAAIKFNFVKRLQGVHDKRIAIKVDQATDGIGQQDTEEKPVIYYRRPLAGYNKSAYK